MQEMQHPQFYTYQLKQIVKMITSQNENAGDASPNRVEQFAADAANRQRKRATK